LKLALTLLALTSNPAFLSAANVDVAFDLPSSIECRDVTTPDFAAAHPGMKCVSARLRISARLIVGNPTEITEFMYVIKTTGNMRVQGYTPETTLESAVAEDHIEITDASENSQTGALDAHVAYKPFLLGGSHNQTSKKTEASHFNKIAPKDIVLASGTIEREHGVFFRIRPSRAVALEGGREFTLTAMVPCNWRGDLCTISCVAKAPKKSMFATAIASVGSLEEKVGLYLSGDAEAAAIAEDLREAQENYLVLRLRQSAKEDLFRTISTHATGEASRRRRALEDARQKTVARQDRLERLSR
jgi:hypothetical protein